MWQRILPSEILVSSFVFMGIVHLLGVPSENSLFCSQCISV